MIDDRRTDDPQAGGVLSQESARRYESEAGRPGERVVSSSLSLKAQESGDHGGEVGCPSSSRESESVLPLSFCLRGPQQMG